jgi:hypothetical protein
MASTKWHWKYFWCNELYLVSCAFNSCDWCPPGMLDQLIFTAAAVNNITLLYCTYRRHSKIQRPYKERQAGFTVDQPEDYNAVFLKTRSSKEFTLLIIVRLSSLPPSQPVRNTVFCVKSKPQNSSYIPAQLPVLSDHSLQGIFASERICAGQR